jgi:hypothetical protein
MIHSICEEALSEIRLPADYYASSASEVTPIFPKWVPLGCGTAAAVFLLAGFVGGAIVMHTGLGKLMSIVLDMSVGELQPMMGKDVTPSQKQALNAELSQLSRNVASDKTSIARLQPVLQSMKEAMADKKITAAEAAKLAAEAHAANQPPQPKAGRASVRPGGMKPALH